VGFPPYDARMAYGAEPGAADAIARSLDAARARSCAVEVDLAEPTAADAALERVAGELGPIRALVLCHCESVDSGLLETTVESFDRHFAVNARASWLLIRGFGRRYEAPFGEGRIVAVTSDHVAGNLPYGASKGALDRITLAAARELAHLGVTANVVNPGPVDTGWMSDELAARLPSLVPLGRLGRPSDTADLVAFLCSAEGGWISGQLLRSDGGLSAPT